MDKERMEIPRPEYPRPSLCRSEDSWVNLNGEWDFAFDFGRSGRARGMAEKGTFPEKILVPFAPESKLSGIEYVDFIPAVWYRRTFTLPASFVKGASRLLLRFGAVDYETEIWINGVSAGTHRGGYTPFALDITDLVTDGENTVTVCAEDDTRDPLIPSGKQSDRYENYGCYYTRCTGIWQTVWLEVVPSAYVEKVKITPDTAGEKVDVTVRFGGDRGVIREITAALSFGGDAVASVTAPVCGGAVSFSVPVKDPILWDLGKPNLYDLTLTAGDDLLLTYFGMRSVAWTDRAFLLNGRPVFQRMVLDQGYYPDGIYTAPTEDELRLDVERAMAVGFNGARLHMKIFEPYTIYWADHLGYMLWGEYPNWGLDVSRKEALYSMLQEWVEAMERDYNSPAVIGWCPFNETYGEATPNGRLTGIFDAVNAVTRAIDPIRPVIDTSGHLHGKDTDIFDVHDYTQDPATLRAHVKALEGDGDGVFVDYPDFEKYDFKRPYFNSEYGGIYWNLDIDSTDPAWGYGTRPKTKEEFLARLKGLTDAMLDSPRMFGFCYTQLTDVFQEKNGIYAFDRREKFDAAQLREIFARPAAIEQTE